MALPTYSSRDVNVSYCGYPLTGLSPDTFVTLARNADLTDEEVGADGQLSVSRMPDRTGTCTITLQQNSLGNLVLAEVINRQETGVPFITGSLEITDPSGTILATLTNAHIKTAPEIGFGSSASGSTRAYVFYCEGMRFTSAPNGIGLASGDVSAISAGVDVILGNGAVNVSGLLAS